MKTLFCIIFFLLFSLLGFAQISELGALTQGDGAVVGYKFNFASELDDTITIKIVDPRGQLISAPIQEKSIMTNQSIPFGFNTRFWLPGQYQILVETEKGSRYVKRLNVDNAGKKITRQ